MLASEPSSSRIHAGGGISVRVNGTAVESQEPDGSIERLSGNLSSKDLAENPSEWAKATITWRNEEQRFADESSKLVHNSNASSSVGINGLTPQLVHVIRVNSSGEPLEVEDTDMSGNVAAPVNSAKIHITTSTPNGTYAKKNVDYCKDKISVMVGSPINHIVKAEDERSSSGASSAPGSDCERSDSDREADDGTDSGFSPSRKHCARVSVNANNSNNNHPSESSICEFNNNNTIKTNVICNGNRNNVKLTISSYSDKESELGNGGNVNKDQWDMHFHLRELDSVPTDKKTDSEDIKTKIAAAHAMLSGQVGETLCLKNKVRSSIVSLLVQSASNRNYDQEEGGRIVFYTTSMGIVRTTFERCRKVRKILETLMVKFEERDVFMNRGFQQEIRERLGTNRVIVPQVFVEGRHLGSAEVVEQLNEIGHLRELLRPYKRQSVGGVCQQCGGYRYLLCPVCGGSKKSVTHRHHFSEDLVALRCVTCDESGLIRCPQCINGEG
ncbi:Glutaredoxin domain-containing cysteine-rich protein, partial [Stegodyphus mimosarum]